MATYTGTPRTWTAAETVTAAMMNSDVRDPFAALAGAWNSYTPTLTGFTPGNGTAAGGYIQVGKLVALNAQFTFGSSSAATATQPSLTLPVTALSTHRGVFWGEFYDVDTGPYPTHTSAVGTSAVSLWPLSTAGSYLTYAATSTTVPFTWAATDFIVACGIYEAA